jgi:hypothetical protein
VRQKLLLPVVALLVVAGGVLLLTLGGRRVPPEAPTPPSDFRIVAAEGDPFLTHDDIESYAWATHTMTLKPGVMAKLESRLLETGEFVPGVPFVVKADGVECYRGTFTSGLSSFSQSGPCIVFHSHRHRDNSDTQMVIEMDYPSSRVPTATDPPSDGRVRATLQALGKLK